MLAGDYDVLNSMLQKVCIRVYTFILFGVCQPLELPPGQTLQAWLLGFVASEHWETPLRVSALHVLLAHAAPSTLMLLEHVRLALQQSPHLSSFAHSYLAMLASSRFPSQLHLCARSPSLLSFTNALTRTSNAYKCTT